MPRVAAVENGERLRDVEVEKLEWWKCKSLVVLPVETGRESEYSSADQVH